MLADRDRIFTNLYGIHSPGLEAARKRGAWDGTKDILAMGRDWVINEALKSVFSRDKAFQEWKERGSHQSSNGIGAVHSMPAGDKPTSDRTRPQRPAMTDANKSA